MLLLAGRYKLKARHVSDDVVDVIFVNGKVWHVIKVSLALFIVQIYNRLALIQIK